MKSRIWHLAGVGLLCLSVNVLAQGDRHGPGPQDPNAGGGGSLPIQPRPDEVRQTQPPRQGHYQDIRQGQGHGGGWGPGPQYRPGHEIDRFPDRYAQVPYRGRDYYFSNGYWYEPHGPRYVVVRPPYGVRVGYLPAYAEQVWINNVLFYLAAGTYYQYLNDSREYVVVNPPVQQPVVQAPPAQGYDVIAYPTYGQTPQQQEQDRYACHRWAVEQTGFDPASASYAPPAQVADNYRRALGACLSGRGYSIN